MKLVSLTFLTLLSSPVDAQTPPSNLPVSAPGSILTVQASALIDAPIETAWNVLLDFQAYPEWNPFVRLVYYLYLKETFHLTECV